MAKSETVDRRGTASLRCILTNDEKLKLGAELADKLNELARHRADLDAVKKQVGSRITAAEARISELSTIVSSGFEVRTVETRITENYQTKTVSTWRVDTGEEIAHRAMTEAELQQRLPI